MVIAALAIGLPMSARAQGDSDSALRAAIAACMKGPETALRECLQKVLASKVAPIQAPPPSPDSKWSVDVKTDKLDGMTSVVSVLDSSDKVSKDFGMAKPARLVVRCLKNQTEVYVHWPDFVGIAQSRQVKWRVDDQPIVTETWTDYSSDGQAAFAPSPIPFLKKLLGGKELVFSLSTFSKVARTVTFPIVGSDEAIKPVRTNCKW